MAHPVMVRVAAGKMAMRILRKSVQYQSMRLQQMGDSASFPLSNFFEGSETRTINTKSAIKLCGPTWKKPWSK